VKRILKIMNIITNKKKMIISKNQRTFKWLQIILKKVIGISNKNKNIIFLKNRKMKWLKCLFLH